jgi:hypothetical protein
MKRLLRRITHMVDAGSEKGAIDPDEKDMIQNIFEFDDTFASDVMTHRTEVPCCGWTKAMSSGKRRLINRFSFIHLFGKCRRHCWYTVCQGLLQAEG